MCWKVIQNVNEGEDSHQVVGRHAGAKAILRFVDCLAQEMELGLLEAHGQKPSRERSVAGVDFRSAEAA